MTVFVQSIGLWIQLFFFFLVCLITTDEMHLAAISQMSIQTFAAMLG